MIPTSVVLRGTLAAYLLALPLLGLVALASAPEAQGRSPQPMSQACPAPATWTLLDGERPRPASTGEVLADMARRDVVLLGEQHDDPDDHRWQLQVLAGLHAQRPEMVIGFESFPRRVQPALDRWVTGELTVSEFLKQAEWDTVWSMPADLYLPLFQFARINRIPMVALNVDRKLTRAIADRGWDAIPEGDREGVGRAASPAPAYRQLLLETYRAHLASGSGEGAGSRREARDIQAGDRRFLQFVESQITWDRAMAEALARHALPRAGAAKPLVVGIMGSGHIRHGHGVPWQLRDLGVTSVGALLPVSADGECGEIRIGLADAVFAVPKPPATAPAPPRLGVRLEERDNAVRVADVTAGSLAERTGIRKGDVLVEVAGSAVKGTGPVIAVVRRQPAGTWLPMRVKRGDETLDLVAKFPVQP